MNIYISNLNYSVTEAELSELVSEYGEVNSVKIILDRETQRSRGFGFVEMSNDQEAKNMIEALHGAEFKGKELRVVEALPQGERPARSNSGNFGGGGSFGGRGGNSRGNHGGGYNKSRGNDNWKNDYRN